MKTLGVIANTQKERAPAVLTQVAATAARLGLDLYADAPTAPLLGCGGGLAPEAIFERVDAVMALGGDGTMLRVVRELGRRNKPVIGVNIGSLGFMTSVAMEDIDRALESIARDDYEISERAVLECTLQTRAGAVGTHRALNDIAIRSGTVRIIVLDVSVNGEPVNSYACDGLIVSTPTGSTGYSLAAGGPIVPPETPVFVVSAICPHSLSSRPLVLPDGAELAITVTEGPEGVLLSSDGQVGQAMQEGDCVEIRRSECSARFIHLPGHSYYEVLRRKLRWRGSAL